MHNTQIIITFETKPESVATFSSLLEQVKRDLPSVPGCRSVRLFAATANPCVFTLLEDWNSETQHRSHIDKMVSSGAWATLAAHLAKDPVSHYYTER
ncbi:MAG TPA: antibiotic biosynthesis monooxygenase family protein [Hydrogenophaga sp.]|nr:antibiotic biosynthesis monooxygenase family protein [Hydrogenophaga sp.]